MRDVWIKRLGEHRGAPRLYLDAAQAVRAGFVPGERFEVRVDGAAVVLTKNPDGSRTVSARKRGDERLPVLDINSRDLLAAFEGMHSVRVVVGEACVYLLPLASEIKKRERLNRLTHKITQGQPLATGSLAHGGGILAHAIHQGLQDAGVRSELAFANELREDLIEHACRFNDAWTGGGSGRTAALVVPMQEAVQDDWLMARLPQLEILEMGLPCSGASKAGVAKRGLQKMEDHPGVGHLVFAALTILNKTQPAVVLLENVVDYKNTASAQILRQQLQDMGYAIHEAVLEGTDFGALENRVRWVMVAVTHGVDFSFEQLQPAVRVVRHLAEVLDDVPLDDPRWSEMKYLKDKQDRDQQKGSNFKMQVMHEDDTRVPTLRKGYHKGGSTDPVLQHPENPALLRRLTAREHARVKGVPPHLVQDMSETMAHQLLGQGIVYEPFRAVGERIGLRIRMAADQADRAGRIAPHAPHAPHAGHPQQAQGTPGDAEDGAAAGADRADDEDDNDSSNQGGVSWRITRMVG